MVIGPIWIEIIGNIINRIHNYEIDDEQNLSCNLKNIDFAFERIYGEVYNYFWNINNLIPKNFSSWYKMKFNNLWI